jgi:hypothetical protein
MESGEVEAENKRYGAQDGMHYQPVVAHDRPAVESTTVPPRSSNAISSEDSIK